MEESGNKLSKQRRRRKILMHSDDEDDGTPSKIQSLMPSESTSFSEVERSESSSYTQQTISKFTSTAQSKTTSTSLASFSSFSKFEKSSFTRTSHADKHETSYKNSSQSNESKIESYTDQIKTESRYSSYSRTEKSLTVQKTEGGELPAPVLVSSRIGDTEDRFTGRDIQNLRPRLGQIGKSEGIYHDNENMSRDDRDISIVDTGKSHTYHDISIKEGNSNISDKSSREHTHFKTNSERYSYSDQDNTKVDYNRSEHYQVTKQRGFVLPEGIDSFFGDSNSRKNEAHTNFDELSGREVELSPGIGEKTKFKIRSYEPEEMSEMDEASIRNRVRLMRAGTEHQYIKSKDVETSPDDTGKEDQFQTVQSFNLVTSQAQDENTNISQGDFRQPDMPARAQMQVKADQSSSETGAFAASVSETPPRDVFGGTESIETSNIHKDREEDIVKEDTTDGVYAEINIDRKNEDQRVLTYANQEEIEIANEMKEKRHSFGDTEDLAFASGIPMKQSESGNVSEEIITIQTGIVTPRESSQPMAQSKQSDVPQKMVGSDEVIIIHAVPIRYETRLHNAILTWPSEQKQQTEDKEVKAHETSPYKVEHHETRPTDTKIGKSSKLGSLLSYAPRPYQKPLMKSREKQPSIKTSFEMRSRSSYVQLKEKSVDVQTKRKSQDIQQPYETPPHEESEERRRYESHLNEDLPNYDLHRYEQQPDVPPEKEPGDTPQSFETPPHKEAELILHEPHLKNQPKTEVTENSQQPFKTQQHKEPEELHEPHLQDQPKSEVSENLQPYFKTQQHEEPEEIRLDESHLNDQPKSEVSEILPLSFETQQYEEPEELKLHKSHLNDQPKPEICENLQQSFETQQHEEPEKLHEPHHKDQPKSEVSENLQQFFRTQQHGEPEELALNESHPNEDQLKYGVHGLNHCERPPDVQVAKAPGEMKQTLETRLHAEPDELMPHEHHHNEDQQKDVFEQPEPTPAGQLLKKSENIQHPYDTPPNEEDELRLHYPYPTASSSSYGAETCDEPSNRDNLDMEEIQPHVSYPDNLHSEKTTLDETDSNQAETNEILPMSAEETEERTLREKNYPLESHPHESSLFEEQISLEIQKNEKDSHDGREEAGPYKSDHDKIQPLLTENFPYSDKVPVRELPDEERTDETMLQNTKLFELPTNDIRPLEDATQQTMDAECGEQSSVIIRHESVKIVDTSNENKTRFVETDPVSMQLGQEKDEVEHFELEYADSNNEIPFEQILVLDPRNKNMDDGAHTETVLGAENVNVLQHTTYKITHTDENEERQEQAEQPFWGANKSTAMEVEQTEPYNVERHEKRTFQTMSYESSPDDMQRKELQSFESQPNEEQSDDEHVLLQEGNYLAGSYNLERRTIRYYETIPNGTQDIVQHTEIQSFEPQKVEVKDNEVTPTNMSNETKPYQVEKREIRSYESQPYNMQTQGRPLSENDQIEMGSTDDKNPEDILSHIETNEIKRYEIRSYEKTSYETEPYGMYPNQQRQHRASTNDQLQGDDDRLYNAEAYDVERREIRSFETTPYGMQEHELQHHDVDPPSQQFVPNKYASSTSDSDEHDTNAEIQSIPESPSRKRKYPKGQEPNDLDDDSFIALHVPIKRKIRITSKPSPTEAGTRDSKMEKDRHLRVSPTREDKPNGNHVNEHISASKRVVLHSSPEQVDHVFNVMEYESTNNMEQYPQKPQSQPCDELKHDQDTHLEMPTYPSDPNVQKYRVDFHIQLSAFETEKPLKSWKSEPILNVDSTQDKKPWRSKSMNFEKKIPKQSSVVIELQKPERRPLAPAYSTDNLPFETVIRNEVKVKLKNKRRRSFPSVFDDHHNDEFVEPSHQNIETEEIERKDKQLTESFEIVDKEYFTEHFKEEEEKDPVYDKDKKHLYEELMENELVRPSSQVIQTEEIQRKDVQLTESFETVDTFFAENFNDEVEEDPAYEIDKKHECQKSIENELVTTSSHEMQTMKIEQKDVKLAESFETVDTFFAEHFKDTEPEYEEPMENFDQSLLKRKNVSINILLL